VKKTLIWDCMSVVGDEVFYTDDKADYFFFGHVIDTRPGRA